MKLVNRLQCTAFTTLYTNIGSLYNDQHYCMLTIFTMSTNLKSTSFKTTHEIVPRKLHARKQQVRVVTVEKRSCPTVSQILSLMRFPSNSMVRILKSILPNATNKGLRMNTTRLKTLLMVQSAEWRDFHTLLWSCNLLWKSHQKIEWANKIFNRCIDQTKRLTKRSTKTNRTASKRDFVQTTQMYNLPTNT